MKKITNAFVAYEPSDSIEIQGKRSDIEKYLNKGYYIKENRNGYWVLVKPAQLNVTLSNSFCTRTFNMKTDVCMYYGKIRISQTLADKFRKDVANGTISLYMDEEGYHSLK
ncbi:MAG: hypothetical protein K0S30_601 [Clostridia bacterium]|jgi:hypothetical protein|nr:hypothetical protein [Clostridia bacterium]